MRACVVCVCVPVWLCVVCVLQPCGPSSIPGHGQHQWRGSGTRAALLGGFILKLVHVARGVVGRGGVGHTIEPQQVLAN